MSKTLINSEYLLWLQELKSQIKNTQIKSAIAVNSELIMLYWDMGRQIVEKQENAKWGSGFIDQLSKDLRREFPDMSGFSVRNIHYCKQFYLFYCNENRNKHSKTLQISATTTRQSIEIKNDIILPQVEAKLRNNKIALIPWGHHKLLLSKCNNVPQAIFYVDKTIENKWSRSELEKAINSNLFNRHENITNNFNKTLLEPDSGLAKDFMKDVYHMGMIQMPKKVKEADLEKALIHHMTEFLTELGKGFAYMGKQYPIKIGTKDYKIDLLFYHTILSCYIVIELKAREFEPDFTGKLAFYTTAVDKLIKKETDAPTIGILLCKGKDDVVVDFALEGICRPLGVGTLSYTELSEQIKSALPSIEELQKELQKFEP